MVVVAELEDLKRIIREELLDSLVNEVKEEIRKEFKTYQPSNTNSYMTVKEAANHFKVDESTIRRWINSQAVKSKKIGGTLYVKPLQ